MKYLFVFFEMTLFDMMRMKDIATFAKGSLDITKPLMLRACDTLRFAEMCKLWTLMLLTVKHIAFVIQRFNFGNKQAQRCYLDNQCITGEMRRQRNLHETGAGGFELSFWQLV